MSSGAEKYNLDTHCTMILKEYNDVLPVFRKMQEVAVQTVRKRLEENNIYITALESRIKKEKSLAGKLELKGGKYKNISSVTDILGIRIITFYSDEVDKIAALIDGLFKVDWNESVDKRKMHDLDSFGYNSLHYICSIPASVYSDPEYPQLNEFRFEVQMRTALQHVWATLDHDTGYKAGVEVPREYLRNLNRLAGMLELVDEQFSKIRSDITNYRREVQSLVRSGNFGEVPLDGDTFRTYLKLGPFDSLNRRIAAINQAEINEISPMPYLRVMKSLGFKTLGDVDRMLKDNADDAYHLAVHQLGNTDIDIIGSTVSIQNVLIVYILKNGGGQLGLERMFGILNGPSDYNTKRAQRIMEQCRHAKFMNSDAEQQS